MTFPAFGPARTLKFATRTTTKSMANNSWTVWDATKDLVIDANPGDVIEVGASGRWDNQAFYGYLDVVTMVSGSPVNSFGEQGAAPAVGVTGNAGISAWQGRDNYDALSGGDVYTVAVGDVVSGQVTLSIRGMGSGGAKSLLNARWWARNTGPQDPY